MSSSWRLELGSGPNIFGKLVDSFTSTSKKRHWPKKMTSIAQFSNGSTKAQDTCYVTTLVFKHSCNFARVT